ncbi:MAG: hypothetical protein KC420_23125, partial [Myxococcales bacterium]|nr:hypothetical protein [Myxococcales bacterium]
MRETPPALVERPPPQYLEQGWDEATRGKWYYTTQGSQLVPYAWFLAVENPSRGGLLRDDEYFEAIGFIPDKETYGGLNRDGLPIGFTLEEDGDRTWLGLTCAACHTADIRFKGTRYRVDGGPAHANLSLFLGDLIEGLKLTADDDARFERFAVKVLSEGADD